MTMNGALVFGRLKGLPVFGLYCVHFIWLASYSTLNTYLGGLLQQEKTHGYAIYE